jgi:hypothetical protein
MSKAELNVLLAKYKMASDGSSDPGVEAKVKEINSKYKPAYIF